ncbi:MAG: hypothetical protein PUB51_00765 [Oscillospiraceae bacterium]|nr:hypothetical protein [Oscillospiraceae bacterium]
MPDYQEMYLKLFRATEDAIDRLIAAQRECEELYLSSSEPKLTPLSPDEGREEQSGEGQPSI